MRVLIAVLALTGCRGLFGLDDPARLVDASTTTGGEDMTTARECWGTEVEVCVRPPPMTRKDLSGTLDTGTMCDVVEKDLCVVAGTNVTITDLRVTGPRPLVIVAAFELAVTGTLDAASHRTGATPNGPGVTTAAACNAFAATPTFQGGQGTTGNGGGGAGGAGGTFLFAAGNGGTSVSTTIGQASLPIASTLRAGCPGQAGGARTGATKLAPGGKGGGAIYLIAGERIQISGKVNASGAAGENGKCEPCAATQDTNDLQNAQAFGGGGGGSGGSIVLEAPAITIAATGIVFADGGGGGQGASRTRDGEVGTESTGAMAALGGRGTDAIPAGTGPDNGGDGGTGSHAATKIGATGGNGESSNLGGGGGGGGGGGRVKLISPTVTNTGKISPTP